MHENSITSFNVQDGTVKRSGISGNKKKYIIIALIIIIVIVAIIIAQQLGLFAKATNLVPPDPIKPLPPSPSLLHRFQKAAVCADGPPCAEIGKNILRRNGSAVDAAIAAMFCNGIVNMHSMGLGGGFLMTVYIRSEEKSYALNAREVAPLNSNESLYEGDGEKSKQGPLAVGVPGELKGYWEAHRRFGKLQWKDLIQPSIELCENGYNVSKSQHDSLLISEKQIRRDPTLKDWFVDSSGKLKPIGSLIKPKKLCETLKAVAENGADDFYNGTLAKKLLEDIKEMGGIITEEDFRNYSVIWSDPVEATFKNKDHMYSSPLPGSGVLLGFILNILDGYNFTKSSVDGINNTVLTYHRIVEAFKYAYAKRTELGDTNFINVTELLVNLTSVEYANDVRLKISDNSTSQDSSHYGAIFYSEGSKHGTAHISVLSENGDAVSVTSSVNIYFGAGITSKQTGIILNSGMDDFSYQGFKSYQNLPGSPNNALTPRKRALSSMSPTIITDENGDVKMVIGASGGTKITTAIALVIMKTLWFEENLKEAIDSPRFHHQLFPMAIEYEYGVLKQIVEGLEAIGHKTKRYREAGSIICALFKRAGEIIANADFRKGGDVFGLD